MFGQSAMNECMLLPGIRTVLDVGCGRKRQHTKMFEQVGKSVTTVDPDPAAEADFVKRYNGIGHPYDLVWCCHTLEHAEETGHFLHCLVNDTRPGGWLAVTVPPMKNEIVGGHVSLWNAGLLLYRLVLAGMPCQLARVRSHGYDVSVVVQRTLDPSLKQAPLKFDEGDIETLARWLPHGCRTQGFDGRIEKLNWSS